MNFAEKMNALNQMNKAVRVACELALHEKIVEEASRKLSEREIDAYAVVGWSVVEFKDPRRSYFIVEYVRAGNNSAREFAAIPQEAVEKWMPRWKTGCALVEDADAFVA